MRPTALVVAFPTEERALEHHRETVSGGTKNGLGAAGGKAARPFLHPPSADTAPPLRMLGYCETGQISRRRNDR